MANLTITQIILDAQRMANRVKDLEAIGNAILVEAEGNNRQLESMRQFQDDVDSLNKLTRDKSNSDMVNKINQQNPSIREIRQENRELKACLEDHQRALEVIMHKYREHMQSKIVSSRMNFKDMYNENLSKVIREQAEKINEMAAVMQKAASIDDTAINNEMESLNKLRMENKGLREMLQISNFFGSSAGLPLAMQLQNSEDKAVQTIEIDNENGNYKENEVSSKKDSAKTEQNDNDDSNIIDQSADNTNESNHSKIVQKCVITTNDEQRRNEHFQVSTNLLNGVISDENEIIPLSTS